MTINDIPNIIDSVSIVNKGINNAIPYINALWPSHKATINGSQLIRTEQLSIDARWQRATSNSIDDIVKTNA